MAMEDLEKQKKLLDAHEKALNRVVKLTKKLTDERKKTNNYLEADIDLTDRIIKKVKKVLDFKKSQFFNEKGILKSMVSTIKLLPRAIESLNDQISKYKEIYNNLEKTQDLEEDVAKKHRDRIDYLTSIRDKVKEISETSLSQIENISKVSKAENDHYKNEIKNKEKISEKYNEITNDAIKNIKKETALKDNANIDDKNRINELTERIKGFASESEKIGNYQEDSVETYNESAKKLQILTGFAKELLSTVMKVKEEGDLSKNYEKEIKNLGILIHALDNIGDRRDSMLDMIKEQGGYEKILTNLSGELLKITEKLSKKSKERIKLSGELVKTKKEQQKIDERSKGSREKIKKVEEDIVKKLEKKIRDEESYKDLFETIGDLHIDMIKTYREEGVITEQFKKMSSEILDDSVSILDKVKAKVLSEEKAGELFNENIKQLQKVKTIQDAYLEGYKEQANKIDELRNKIERVKGAVMGFIFNPLTAALAIATWIGKIFVDWVQAGEDFRKATAITGAQFTVLNDQATAVASTLGRFGITQKEALEQTQALVGEFGSLDMINTKLIEDATVISVALGMSADESAKLVASFMNMTAGSSETAINMIKITKKFAEASGVAPGVVMRDIAESSEEAAKYSKGMGQNIVMAAVAARKLGVNLATVTGIADKLLDFESSIEAQMNAMVLTGRNVNLDRARALALEGDLMGLQKEIVNVIGSEAEFQRMNVIQRKAMADAIGVSVSELGKMISRSKELDKVATHAMSAFEVEGLSLSEALDVEGVLSPLTQLKNSLANIGTVVLKTILPLLNLVMTTLSKVASGIGWVMGGIDKLTGSWDKATTVSKEAGISITGIGKALLYAAAAAGALWGIFKTFSLAKTGLGSLLGGKGAAGKVGGKRGILGSIFGDMKPTQMLAAGASLIMIAGAVFILAKAMQEFATVGVGDMAKAGASLVGLVVAVEVLSKIAGKAIIGAVAIGLMAGSMLLLGIAMQKFTDVGWGDLAKAAVVLVGLTAAVFALGALITSGVGAVLFGAGIVAMFALAGAFTALGFSTQILSTGLNAIIDPLSKLGEIATSLMTASVAILSLSSALVAFSAANAVAGVGGFITGLLPGGGLIEQLEKLASLAPGLQETANAVKIIATGGVGGVVGGVVAPAAEAVGTVASTEIDMGEVVDRLDNIASRLENGVELKLNGARIGEFLAKTARK